MSGYYKSDYFENDNKLNPTKWEFRPHVEIDINGSNAILFSAKSAKATHGPEIIRMKSRQFKSFFQRKQTIEQRTLKRSHSI